MGTIASPYMVTKRGYRRAHTPHGTTLRSRPVAWAIMSIGGAVIGHIEYNAPSFRTTFFGDDEDRVGQFPRIELAMEWLRGQLP
jgi:hypothetical protein